MRIRFALPLPGPFWLTGGSKRKDARRAARYMVQAPRQNNLKIGWEAGQAKRQERISMRDQYRVIDFTSTDALLKLIGKDEEVMVRLADVEAVKEGRIALVASGAKTYYVTLLGKHGRMAQQAFQL